MKDYEIVEFLISESHTGLIRLISVVYHPDGKMEDWCLH